MLVCTAAPQCTVTHHPISSVRHQHHTAVCYLLVSICNLVETHSTSHPHPSHSPLTPHTHLSPFILTCHPSHSLLTLICHPSHSPASFSRCWSSQCVYAETVALPWLRLPPAVTISADQRKERATLKGNCRRHNVHTHTHARTHARTHAHTHAHTRTHAHTHKG